MRSRFSLSLVILFTVLSISCSKKSDEILAMLQEIKQQNSDLKAQVTNLQKTTDSLSNALKLANQNIASMDKKIDSIRNQLSSMVTQINSLSSQLNQANVNIADLQKRIAELQAKCQELVDLLRLLTGTLGLSDGLVAYYPFSGNAGDSSGNGNHGTVNGAILSNDRFNKANSSYAFNGLNNYVRIKSINMNASEQMTISVWLKPTNISQNRFYTITRQEDLQPKLALEWLLAFQEFGTILSFGLNTNGTQYNELDVPINQSKFTDGNWHNITAVYDGKNRFLYVDDLLIGSDSKTGSVTFLNTTGSIGSTSATLEEFFNGNIDDLRFYRRALNKSEITYLATH